MSGSLQEYKELVVSYLRDVEASRAYGNSARQRRLDDTSDDDLLRKWLWLGSIVGGLACGAVAALLTYVLPLVIPYLLLELVWIVLRLAIGMVIIMLGLALYLTFGKKQ